jgi:hypothetical protein
MARLSKPVSCLVLSQLGLFYLLLILSSRPTSEYERFKGDVPPALCHFCISIELQLGIVSHDIHTHDFVYWKKKFDSTLGYPGEGPVTLLERFEALKKKFRLLTQKHTRLGVSIERRIATASVSDNMNITTLTITVQAQQEKLKKLQSECEKQASDIQVKDKDQRTLLDHLNSVTTACQQLQAQLQKQVHENNTLKTTIQQLELQVECQQLETANVRVELQQVTVVCKKRKKALRKLEGVNSKKRKTIKNTNRQIRRLSNANLSLKTQVKCFAPLRFKHKEGLSQTQEDRRRRYIIHRLSDVTQQCIENLTTNISDYYDDAFGSSCTFRIGKSLQISKRNFTSRRSDDDAYFGLSSSLSLENVQASDEQLLTRENQMAIAARDTTLTSQKSYHTFSANSGKHLPTLYKLKQAEKAMDSHIADKLGVKIEEVHDEQGEIIGCFSPIVDIITGLFRNGNLSEEVMFGPPEDDPTEVQTLHLLTQGDGAMLGDKNKNCQFAFGILNEGIEMLQPSHHYTHAMIEGSESYEVCSTSLAAVFDEMEKMSEPDYLLTLPSGRKVKVKWYLSSDWKFLQIMLGIKGPTAKTEFCLFCHTSKDKIADKQHQDTTVKLREQWCKYSTRDRKKYYTNKPLYHFIPFERIVIDVLHLFLRTSERLFLLLVEEVNFWYGSEGLERLRHEIVDILKVKKFQWVYEDSKKDNGRVKGLKIDWSKLEGGDLDIILKGLNLEVLLPEKQAMLIRELWDTYTTIIQHTRSWERTCTDEDFGDLCDHFRKLYLDGGSTDPKYKKMSATQRKNDPEWCKGAYRQCDVTPYLHVLMFHLRTMYATYDGNLMQFSCYALEHSNHLHTKIFFRATSHNGGKYKKEIFLKSIFRKLMRLLYNPEANKKKRLQCEHCYKSYDRQYWFDIHNLKHHPNLISNIDEI